MGVTLSGTGWGPGGDKGLELLVTGPDNPGHGSGLELVSRDRLWKDFSSRGALPRTSSGCCSSSWGI